MTSAMPRHVWGTQILGSLVTQTSDVSPSPYLCSMTIHFRDSSVRSCTFVITGILIEAFEITANNITVTKSRIIMQSMKSGWLLPRGPLPMPGSVQQLGPQAFVTITSLLSTFTCYKHSNSVLTGNSTLCSIFPCLYFFGNQKPKPVPLEFLREI